MFPRFVAGSGIASIAIALGTLALVIIPTLSLQRTYPLTTIWCFMPLAWGIWALITPASWMPQRLPIWGAILGLIAGSLGALVLNLPSRVFGTTVPVIVRGVAVVVMAGFYYLLWMLVPVAYTTLAARPEERA